MVITTTTNRRDDCGTNDVSGKTSSTQNTPTVVYIGKDLKGEVWYFVSIKDGCVRFLRFAFPPFYPYWIYGVNTGKVETHSVPDKLSPLPCPREVWDEVQLFVTGKVTYEFIPSKKGRKASVSRTFKDNGPDKGSVREERESERTDDLPTTTATDSCSKYVRGLEGDSVGPSDPNRVQRDASKSKRGRNNSTPGYPERRSDKIESSDGAPEERVRKKRKPSILHELVESSTKVSLPQETKVSTKKAGPATTSNLAQQPVKRGRGRPKAILAVDVTKDKRQTSNLKGKGK